MYAKYVAGTYELLVISKALFSFYPILSRHKFSNIRHTLLAYRNRCGYIHPRGEEIPRYFTEVLEGLLSQLSLASERKKKKTRHRAKSGGAPSRFIATTLRTASIFFFFFFFFELARRSWERDYS